MQKNAAKLYLFNPTCEYAIANGTLSWQPNRLLQKMETDLDTLPLYFADSTDYVIVHQLPSADFLKHLATLKIRTPKFVLKDEVRAGKLNFEISELRPWGWSPAAHKYFENVKTKCSPAFQASPIFSWEAGYKELYSKRFARKIQREICERFPSEDFISTEQLTEICTTKADFEYYIQKWGKLMVKTPWSSSGRGLQPIRHAPIHQKVWDKILGIVKEQGYAIVEPYHEKIIDLAFQYKLEKGKVSYLGVSNFKTDYKGKYDGNSLNGLPNSLNPKVKSFVEKVHKLVISQMIEIIEGSELAQKYEGPFGVDTLIFKDASGKLKVNPCLEINVRYNMGLLSLQVEKLVAPHQKASYHTRFQPGETFYDFAQQMQKKHPLILNNNKITSGFYALSNVKPDSQFGAYLLV